MSTESLTSKVHEARVDLGITQQQLADATGISVRTIISIEKGRQFPTLLSAMRIAHYFSLSVDQLFEYKYDDNSEKEKTNDKRGIHYTYQSSRGNYENRPGMPVTYKFRIRRRTVQRCIPIMDLVTG